MPQTWTPEDEAELARLKASVQQDDADRETAAAALPSTPEERGRPVTEGGTNDFSLYRVVVGGAKDFGEDLVDTALDISSSLSHKFLDLGLAPGTVAAFLGSAPLVGGVLNSASTLPALNETVGGHFITTDAKDGHFEADFGHLKGEENAGLVERFARGLVSFGLGFATASGGISKLRAGAELGAEGLPFLERLGRGAAAGFLTDFVETRPEQGNIADLLKSTFGLTDSQLLDLTTDPDDSTLMARFKAAATGVPVGILTDSLVEAGAKGLRAYKAWKGTQREAEATVDALNEKYGINLMPENGVGSPESIEKSLVRSTPQEGEIGSPGALRATEGEPGYPGQFASEGPAGVDQVHSGDWRFYSDIRDAKPKSFSEVMDALKNKVNNLVDPDAIARIARDLLGGDQENVLTRMGIDPSKLDFSAFDKPESLAKMQEELADILSTVARKAGRTGERVSDKAVAAGARALATNADVLRTLHGNTQNLPEIITAARLFTGAHAHQLMRLADQAGKEIKEGAPGPKWAAFTEAFRRHALYMGAVRGAKSEVGRALRSLRTDILSSKEKSKLVAQVEEGLDDELVQQSKGELQDSAQDYLDTLASDADKLDAISRVLEHKGDVGELAKYVRSKNMTPLKRLNLAMRETTGNLFSLTTAVSNTGSGLAMLGMTSLTKALKAGIFAAGDIFSGGMSARTRQAAIEAWAYTDGIVSGFGEAFGNVAHLLQRELGGEASLNLDALGLHSLAKDAAKVSYDGARAMTRAKYERADVVNDRLLSMSNDEITRFQNEVDKLKGPKFYLTALKDLVRLGGVAVNAAGSASRIGTTLFINATDEFVGTMAAKAGSRARAVQLAAQQAAEYGLEGKDLTEYLKAQTQRLTSGVEGWHEDGWSAAAKEVSYAAGNDEARQVLFQDQLDSPALQALTHGMAQVPFLHVIVPFVHTPLRILERVGYDYTPLGLLRAKYRKAIIGGGNDAAEARIRLGLGMSMVMSGYLLGGDDRTVIGSDGAYTSTGRLTRPAYSLKVGGDVIEYNDIDPVSLLLGFGADMRAYMDAHQDDPEAPGVVTKALQGMVLAVSANALAKSWLTSLNDLSELAKAAASGDTEQYELAWKKYAGSLSARFIPGSGIQRSITKETDPFIHEAMSFKDNMMRNSLLAGQLPVKRDPILGEPVEIEGGERLGFPIHPLTQPTNKDEAVRAELGRLSFRFPKPQWTQMGVKLTAGQYSQMLKIKGEIKDPATGLTIKEALGRLMDTPAYANANDDLRTYAVRKVISPYQQLAVRQLLHEDKDFASHAIRADIWDRLQLQGASRDEKIRQTSELTKKLGLPDPGASNDNLF